jgi:hypothetical protein
MKTGLVDAVMKLAGAFHAETAEGQEEHAKTNYVLLDFENVQPGNLELLQGGPFKIMVFVGSKQKVSVDVAKAVQPFGPDGDYIQIQGSGKNALDFHIAYYIGRLAAESPEAYFHIISKDAGFDPLIAHLKERRIHCKRSSSISEIPLLHRKTKSESPPVMKPNPPKTATVTPEPAPCATPLLAEPLVAIPEKSVTQPVLAKAPAVPKPKPVASVIKHLAKSTKPRTEKTLKSAIKGVLGAESSDQQITDVIKELKKRGVITDTDGKITYSLPS